MPTRHSADPAEGIDPQTPHLYVPTAQRPLRAKERRLSTAQRVVPHRHPWAQLAFSTTGVIRLTTDHGTYLVPPSRAVWVPPGIEHAVTVVEDATLRTLYLHQPPGRCGPAPARDVKAKDRSADATAWRACRVLEVSDLLRALVSALDTTADGEAPAPSAETLQRERLIAPLLQDELRRARPLAIGIDLPHDKRLRHLCEAVIAHPARHATLDDWARNVGASPRTLARLFREQLDTSFGQWRRQVLLAQALALAGRGRPMAQIATELGYASPSAFTAMFTRTVGAPPSRFFAAAERQGSASLNQ